MKKNFFLLITLFSINIVIAQTAANYTSVKFVNTDTGYVVGSGGTILKTINGGNNWIKQNSGITSNSFYSVFFNNSSTGYVSGEGEIILKTTDEGTNWVCQNSVSYLTRKFSQIFFPNSNIGYAVGSYKGKIFKTTNGGTNWVQQISGTTRSLSSVYFTDINTGYIVGLNDTILKTTDGGNNWIKQTSATSKSLTFIYFQNSNIGYAVGGSGAIIKTTDGGTDWAIQTSVTTNILNSIYFSDPNTGFAVGNNGTIIKTTDGGDNWATQTSGTTNNLTSVYFTLPNTGYAVGGNNTILKTTDGGAHWFTQNSTFETLDINNISARINNNNDLFWDLQSHPKFEVPKGSGRCAVFNSTLWIAGLDSIDSLHVAAQLYNSSGSDFWSGPISNVYDPVYDSKWNLIWKINKSDIDYHKLHYADAGYIPINSIATWPGNGDTALGQAEQLAPYYDTNGDNLYNHLDGDYPLIKGDQAVFFIINDDRGIHTESKGKKLGIEMQCMAYAYNCSDSAFWNTMFLNYKIFNRSSHTYDSIYVGNFTDFDIGGAWDDYIGCDVQRGAFYGYNGDLEDTPSSGELAYGAKPPMEACTVLGGPLLDPDDTDNPDSIGYGINGLNFGDSIKDNERFGLCNFFYFNNSNGPNGNPNNATEYYSYLKGLWRDGMHLTYGGNGHDGTCGPEANFMFPGNSDLLHWGTNYATPNCNVNNWTEKTVGNVPYDRRGFGSMGPFTFMPGAVEEIDLAFIYARNFSDSNNFAAYPIMQQRIDTIRKYFTNNTPCEQIPAYINKRINTNNSKLLIYPNPATNNITIEIPKITEGSTIYVCNINGQELIKQRTNTSKTKLDVSTLPGGVYFVKVVNEKGVNLGKFVKSE
ncbi:MAG: YCF48-related protein [Bacteroidales bacterium]|jgi:photosystem II stability/assembly factor-like uncharacterized protein